MTVTKPENTNRSFQGIGEYRHHFQCRFCLSYEIKTVIDFGNVPLAGGFLDKKSTKKDFEKERLYPLRIAFCPHCYLLQVIDIVDSSILYKDYFYFSSAIGTLVTHFRNYATELKQKYPDAKKRIIAEIGCNDGVFLKPLKKVGFQVIGIDLAKNVVKPLIKQGFDIVVDYFGEKSASKIISRLGQVDVVVTSNSFAHIDDMHDVMSGIKMILKKDGILVVEVHYLGALIKETQYDMMYHDHESYYSLIALENLFRMYEMEVYDVKPISIHAGSMRFYVQNKEGGKNRISSHVSQLRKEELSNDLDKTETYTRFFTYIQKTKKDLLILLQKLKKDNKTVAGYGASGRATAMMSFCVIDDKLLDYVIDDAPAKQGAYTPGNHLRIVSSAILDNPINKPDYCLIFAWAFIREISQRKTNYLQQGGKFIVPLPKVHIVSA